MKRGRKPQAFEVQLSVRMVPLADEHAVERWFAALDWLDKAVEGDQLTVDSQPEQTPLVGRDYRGTLIYDTGDGALVFRDDNPIQFLTVSEAEAFVDASLLVSQVLSQIQHSTDP